MNHQALFTFMVVYAWSTICLSTQVAAEPLTWNLNNVEFNDSSTATGSFDYDADVNEYSNITVTTGLRQYTSLFASFGVEPFFLYLLEDGSTSSSNLTGQYYLQLDFDDALTSNGGSVDLVIDGFSYEAICASADCTSVDILHEVTSDGYVTTAIPSQSPTESLLPTTAPTGAKPVTSSPTRRASKSSSGKGTSNAGMSKKGKSKQGMGSRSQSSSTTSSESSGSESRTGQNIFRGQT